VVAIVALLAAVASPATASESPAGGANGGESLFREECASCHGFTGKGVEGSGPDLRGAGAAAADFYLRTGRMPLANPGDQPLRSKPRYDNRQLKALISYVGSLGGPVVPKVDPGAGSVSRGQELFTSSCAGCHAISGVGGVAVGAYAPNLQAATPTEIAEAIRVGPYVMPAFGRRQLSDADVNSIARYIGEVVDHPEDRGGWGIGHIGPVPEGMVAWLLAAVALIVVAALIGERRRRS
jgi:ubiquinol-cytochrome c reductase cytochrome c subunit